MTKEIAQKIHTELSTHRAWIDGILLVLLATYILSGIQQVPFHGDESTYIWMSSDYDNFMKERDLSAILFNPEKEMQNSDQRRRLSVGSILIYSIGIARDIANMDTPLNHRWSWSYPPDEGDKMWADNLEDGNMPDSKTLILARFCSALMGVFGVVFLFLALQQLFKSHLYAWTVVVLFATHGDVLVGIRRAMQEGPKFLFLFVTLFLGAKILADLRQTKQRRYLYALMGIASGFTLAAKQDAAPILVAIYAAILLVPVWKREGRALISANVLYITASTILAYAIFLALMPIFWGWWETILLLFGLVLLLFQLPVLKVNRSARLLALAGCTLVFGLSIAFPSLWNNIHVPVRSMLEVRDAIVGVQVQYRVKYGLPYLDTFDHKLSFLLRTTFTSNVMYVESPRFDIDPINEQIQQYTTSFYRGRTGEITLDGLLLLLFAVGTWSLFKKFNEQSLLLFSLFVLPAVILLVSVPLAFQRYFLIMQIPYSLIAGAGAGQVWEWLKRLKARNLPRFREAGSS